MITLTKDGFFFEKKRISAARLPQYAWERVRIKGRVTARDVFKVVSKEPALWGILIPDCSIDIVLKEYERSRRLETNNKWVTSIEFCWCAERSQAEPHKFQFFGKWYKADKSDDFEIYLSVSGKKQGSKEYRSISLCDQVDYLDAAIRINPEVRLHSSMCDKDGKHTWEDSTLGKRYPKLVELFRALFWDITFYGAEEEREALIGKLEQSRKDYEEGKAKMYDVFTGEEVTGRGGSTK